MREVKPAEFFRRNRAEVLSVGIFEFDEEKYRAVIREDAREDGFAEGQAQGLALGKAEGQALGKAEGQDVGARALIEICQEFGISKEATFEKVIEKFSIDREQGEKYIEKYWKE